MPRVPVLPPHPVRTGWERPVANEIAPNLHEWWCANLGRPLRVPPQD